MKAKLYKLFLIVFFLFYLLIFLGTIFDNKSLLIIANPLISIMSFISITVFLILVYKKLLKNINENISLKKEIKLCIILGAIFLIIQGIYAFFMTQYPIWDWSNVYEAAKNILRD